MKTKINVRETEIRIPTLITRIIINPTLLPKTPTLFLARTFPHFDLPN